jgi:hypothetical protein
VFGKQEHGLDVDLHHAPVFPGLLVDDAAAAADANIVVEEVEPAPAVDGGLGQPFAIGFAGDVAAHRRSDAPSASIISTVRPASPGSRSATTTLAPARASKIAAARPLPIPSPAAPPPLTIATLPAKPASSSRSFVRASASRLSTVSPANNTPGTRTSAHFIKAGGSMSG